MEGRETDLEYNLLMGLTGASVSKHLLDEHFTLLWANDFYYDMIGYPKEDMKLFSTINPICIFKGYDEAWNILSKNVYETIANKASGYETVIQMPTRKGKRWTKITSTFTVPTTRRHPYLLYGNDRCRGRNAKADRANDHL